MVNSPYLFTGGYRGFPHSLPRYVSQNLPMQPEARPKPP